MTYRPVVSADNEPPELLEELLLLEELELLEVLDLPDELELLEDELVDELLEDELDEDDDELLLEVLPDELLEDELLEDELTWFGSVPLQADRPINRGKRNINWQVRIEHHRGTLLGC